MPIERFSRSEFETTLDALVTDKVLAPYLARNATVLPLGLKFGEYTYRIPTKRHDVWLHVRSSVDESGYAAEQGQDSIRVWIGRADGYGLMGKTQRWVTRQAGWQARLHSVMLATFTEWEIKQAELAAQPETPTERTMASRYDGWCRACRGKIRKGEKIALRDIGMDKPQWVHAECPVNHAARRIGGEQDVRVVVVTDETDTTESLGALRDFFTNAEVEVTREIEPVDVAETVFTPSEYQVAIFDFVEHGKGNGVVEAVAGSGKTTTLVKALSYIPPETKCAFLAFNRHIAQTLKDKQANGEIPAHIQVRTVHSLGMSNLLRVLKVADSADFIDKSKLDTVMNQFKSLDKSRQLTNDVRAVNIARRQLVAQFVSLCKGTLLDAIEQSKDINVLLDMADHYGIDLNGFTETDLVLVSEVIQRCADTLEVIDFDDMVWLPVQLNLDLEKFDMLFVDEAQDLNAVQIEFVLRSLAPDGRIIAVGDRSQSLYGFRGADINAMPRLIEALRATVLPLSITYRCPTSHVSLAQAIVPAIEARPGAPEGKVIHVQFQDVARMAEPGDLVICRTNAPLVPLAFDLIRRGIKATVKGRDIGQGLIDLVDKFAVNELGALALNMREYLDRETIRLSNAEKWEQLQNLTDRIETVHAVMSECHSVSELKQKLDRLFSDSTTGALLSSVHRAKGSEANRVFILRPELMPHPYAKKGWQQVQERNALYVALTRSKDELVFVEGKE